MKPTLNQNGEYTIRWPRPWRATLWWIAAGILLVGGTIGLRFWWQHKADQLWHTEVNRLRAAGEKVTRSDFQPPLISDNVNAAEYIKAAWALAGKADAQHDAEIIALIRKAASRSQADWKIDLSGSVFGWSMPSYIESGATAEILLNATRKAHAAGNDAEAIQLVLDQIGMLRHMYGMIPGMSAMVTTNPLEMELQRQIDAMVSDLRIGSAPGNASPEQVRRLIDELISDDRLMLMIDSVWQGERVLAAELERELEPTDTITWWPIRPAARMASYRMMLQANEYGAQFRKSPVPVSAPALLPSPPTFMPPLYRVTHLESQIQMFSAHWSRMVVQYRTSAKVVGIKLAIKLYRAEHNGALPESLDEMVPVYWAEVPVDPATGLRFQFAPEGLTPGEGGPSIYLDAGDNAGPASAPQTSWQYPQFWPVITDSPRP